MKKQKVTFNGEVFTVSQCARILGVRVDDIRFRVEGQGMSLEDACSDEFSEDEIRESRIWNTQTENKEALVKRKVRRKNGILPTEWTFDGKTMSPEEWAAYLGITLNALRYRVKSNWPLERILSPSR